MSLSLSASRKLLTGSLFLAASLALSSSAADYITNGAEYAIAGALRTDQVHPRLAIAPTGGFLVWQDSLSDTEGLGVSAIQLDSGLSPLRSPIRVNQNAAGDQERPQVALLKSGGAVFVWQGGTFGAQHIFARFLSASGTWLGDDVPVSAFPSSHQTYPSVAVLENGNVIVVWSSYNQRSGSSYQDVFGQILSPTGEKIGDEFPINVFAEFNQRTPDVAALEGGGFVVVWISEQQRNGTGENPDPNAVYSSYVKPSVDVYARRFSDSGNAIGTEFLVNTSTKVCANPAVSAKADRGFTVVWGERDLEVQSNSWDIFARSFSEAGLGGAVVVANERLYGDQFDPQVSRAGDGSMVVWTSLAQDGSGEGIYARVLGSNGAPLGGEFRVNTTTISKQMHPGAAGDSQGRVLVVWTSYLGGTRSFDLFAQRYANTATPLPTPEAVFAHVPFALKNGAYDPTIQVSWPEQAGFPGSTYEVYVNGAADPVTATASNIWYMTAAQGLKPATTVSFRIAFVAADGRRSSLSAPVTATTWSGFNWAGVPFEWMTANFGGDISAWPKSSDTLATDGPTVAQVFVSGGKPSDPATWLRAVLAPTSKGMVLKWNPAPGLLYQVQKSADLILWENVGAQRLATGVEDELNVGLTSSGYYRVMLLR